MLDRKSDAPRPSTSRVLYDQAMLIPGISFRYLFNLPSILATSGMILVCLRIALTSYKVMTMVIDERFEIDRSGQKPTAAWIDVQFYK